MSVVVHRMIKDLVEDNVEEVRKMKKAEIVQFAEALLRAYYLELSDETIEDLYYDR